MVVTDEILETIQMLRTRPKMAIALDEIGYLHLKIYVEGYLYGIGEVLNIKMLRNISGWFQRKIDQPSSFFFTNQISSYYRDKTDEELKAILLQTLEDYFIENPDWNKKQ